MHVFHFQGSRSSEGCFLNLGAHLTFLPPEGGLDVPPARFDDAHCAFRIRVSRPGSSEAWPYGRDETQALVTIREMATEWRAQALPFFQMYGSFPDAFIAQLSAHHPDGDRSTLHYARIAQHLGLHDKAIDLANEGLALTSERATGLRASYAIMLKDLGARSAA